MEKIGINPVQLAAQLVNVTILILVLKKFLYKPVLSVLLKRQQAIEEGLKLRDEMETKIKKLEEKEKELENKSKSRAGELEAAALKEAKEAADRILSDAKKAADKIKLQAKEDALTEMAAAKHKLSVAVTAQATELANQALAKLLPKEARVKLTEAQIKRMTGE